MPPTFSTLNHPMRVPLAAEIHSRPFLQLGERETVSHFAIFGGAAPQATLASLCSHFGVAAPGPSASYFFHDFGRFRLKWERHTEFATYTFAHGPDSVHDVAAAFARTPRHLLPEAWLLGLSGCVMVAADLVLGPAAELSMQAVHERFEERMQVGGHVMTGGELWTDFDIQADGISRFLVRDLDMRARQGSRLVQRVLEIETYRMMALLGLPVAQQAGAMLNRMEEELAALTSAMVQEPSAEEALLDQITRLAARMEKLALDNTYRFAASKAYFSLVNARIEELREQRVEGVPTVGEFMDRRLRPAMNTCEAIAARQDALARRIADTNDLLRTNQNRRILQSMNARAAQQLHLQQAVEGLSVAAISYYVIGLLSYAGKAAKVAGLAINPELAAGALVIPVALAVWAGLRRLHQRMPAAAH